MTYEEMWRHGDEPFDEHEVRRDIGEWRNFLYSDIHSLGPDVAIRAMWKHVREFHNGWCNLNNAALHYISAALVEEVMAEECLT